MKTKQYFILLKDLSPNNYLLIEHSLGIKYTRWLYDLIKTSYNLKKEAQEQILQLFYNYIEKHKQYRKIARQYFGVGFISGHITVLNEDVRNIETSVLSILNNKNNLVRIGMWK